MVNIRCFLLFVMLTLASAGQIQADIPVPIQIEPPKSADATPLVVYVDHSQPQTRLLIPKRMTDQPSEFQPLPAVTPRRQGAVDLRGRTVVAGMTLSLLLAGGGVATMLIRRRRGRPALVGSVAILATLGACISLGVADIPPRPDKGRTFDVPGSYFGAKPPVSPVPHLFRGSIVIEPVEQSNRVTLIIGRDLAGSFSEIEPPPPR